MLRNGFGNTCFLRGWRRRVLPNWRLWLCFLVVVVKPGLSVVIILSKNASPSLWYERRNCLDAFTRLSSWSAVTNLGTQRAETRDIASVSVNILWAVAVPTSQISATSFTVMRRSHWCAFFGKCQFIVDDGRATAPFLVFCWHSAIPKPIMPSKHQWPTYRTSVVCLF